MTRKFSEFQTRTDGLPTDQLVGLRPTDPADATKNSIWDVGDITGGSWELLATGSGTLTGENEATLWSSGAGVLADDDQLKAILVAVRGGDTNAAVGAGFTVDPSTSPPLTIPGFDALGVIGFMDLRVQQHPSNTEWFVQFSLAPPDIWLSEPSPLSDGIHLRYGQIVAGGGSTLETTYRWWVYKQRRGD